MTRKPLTVACLQHACNQDRETNLAASARGLAMAAEQGAQLALLPELHTMTYPAQTRDTARRSLAEPVPGPTTAHLAALARKLGMVIVGSVYEASSAERGYNTAVVLDRDGTLAGTYRKVHIPDDPGYHERYYFLPGTGFKPIDTSLGRLGVLVCWDQWFPEAARSMALAGAELLLYPTAIGADSTADVLLRQRERRAWITVQRGHAIANSLPLLACNRCGFESRDAALANAPAGKPAGIDFWGNSFVCDGQGEVLAQAGVSERVIVATVDLAQHADLERVWRFRWGRQPRHYNDITSPEKPANTPLQVPKDHNPASDPGLSSHPPGRQSP